MITMFDYFANTPLDTILTDAVDISLRALIAVITLFLLTKLMGEKQIAELNFFDYIEGITIGSIGAELAVNPATPHLYPILAMVVFALFSKLMSKITLLSTKARKVINGTPITLIKEGEICYEGLKIAELTVNELLAELRIAGYFDVADVRYAYMESSGQFSISPYAVSKPVTCGDMRLDTVETPMNYVLVLDGVVIEDNLQTLSVQKEDIYSYLTQNGVTIEDTLLLTMSENGEYKVYTKSTK